MIRSILKQVHKQYQNCIPQTMHTYVGSLAKFRNKQTFSMDPFSSKSCLKNLAVSMFTLRLSHLNDYACCTCAYPHSRKNNGEVIFMIIYHSFRLALFDKASLSAYHGSNLQLLKCNQIVFIIFIHPALVRRGHALP